MGILTSAEQASPLARSIWPGATAHSRTSALLSEIATRVESAGQTGSATSPYQRESEDHLPEQERRRIMLATRPPDW